MVDEMTSRVLVLYLRKYS